MKLAIAKEEMVFAAQRAVYWAKESTLILADLHVGKSAHFRKQGIPLPSNLFYQDINTLIGLVETFAPQKVLLLGDLYHSKPNEEFLIWREFIELYPKVKVELVIGNHERSTQVSKYFEFAALYDDAYEWGPFLFSHEPIHDTHLYNIAGHLHPGIRLHGSGSQSMRMACFWIQQQQMILPAFSSYSGKFLIEPRKSDKVLVPVENELVLFEDS